MISEIIRQRSTWSVPLPRKEPFTLAMVDALRSWLHQHSQQSTLAITFLIFEYAVYDWVRLGFFTGSRNGEYCQSASHKKEHHRYACIPSSKDAGVWAGQPLAFIAADFTFYDHDHIQVDRQFCYMNTALSHIRELHLRFRFDKSKQNFTIRKYLRQPQAPFDPVIASINILRRAYLLEIPIHEPVGQFRLPGHSKNSHLCDKHVRDTMRMACCLAYPNAQHYCRLHIKGIVSHSNRVTAALCLKLGGASDETIAFRLRWHVSSVPTYLRECFVGIDDVMQTAIRGAFHTL
jgi:hypothetical protein